ncbi:MAG: hydroxymethylbilane synthase [Burkholderiaceae bacterium]
MVSESPPRDHIVIASRESRLAMWQAEHVRDRLAVIYPEVEVRILGLTTRGDQIQDRALSEIGGKGLFIKELEVAIADGRADLAVHSLKDVPMQLPDGFELGCIMAREDPRDAFVSLRYADLDALPAGARLGTSSLRRAAQILARYPGLDVQPLRGNINTRMAKLDAGDYDAIVLAAAGLKRLDMADRIRSIVPPALCVPAAGQGALAIEIRAGDDELRKWLAPLDCEQTRLEVTVERRLSWRLGGSCKVPLAAYCVPDKSGALQLTARVAAADGSQVLESIQSLTVTAESQAELLGDRAADDLILQGAERWLPLS